MTQLRQAGMPLLCIHLYSALLYLLIPFELLRICWRGRRLPAYRQRWEERFGVFPELEQRPRIWLHSVTVGETIDAAPLLQRLLEQYPDYSILVTTTMPTGSEQLRRLFGERVDHVYFPYDLPHVMQRFIAKTKPRLLLLMQTELWPNCLKHCHDMQIPVILANARLSQRSHHGYGKVKQIVAPLLNSISFIAAQTQQDRMRFVELGTDDARIAVLGNVKSDAALADSVRSAGFELRRRLGRQRPVWIAALTHRGEERLVLEALRKVQHYLDDVLLILVPRHAARFDEVASLCLSSGFTLARRSAAEWPSVDTDIYLGDTMGELMQLYGAADLAFVGGSLVPTGGYNPMEPAMLAKPVLTGPYMQNFSDVYSELLSHDAANVVNFGPELGQQVIRYLSDDWLRERVGKAALATVEKRRGASDNLMGLISRIVRGY